MHQPKPIRWNKAIATILLRPIQVKFLANAIANKSSQYMHQWTSRNSMQYTMLLTWRTHTAFAKWTAQ